MIPQILLNIHSSYSFCLFSYYLNIFSFSFFIYLFFLSILGGYYCLISSKLSSYCNNDIVLHSSNSTFSECVRNQRSNNQSPFTNEDPTYNKCINNNGTITSCEGPDTLPGRVLSSSATFIACTFASLTSSDSGGAISFTDGDTLSVDQCIFTDCTNTHSLDRYEGGGGVYSKCGSLLSVSSSVFISCITPSFGGGVLATDQCSYSYVTFCTFISSRANHGGGLCVFFGPSSLTSACTFISCTADYIGGGMYHDSLSIESYLRLTDSLFKGNTANYGYSRGGGGFEDYHQEYYKSHYYFSFFTGNYALSGCGHDLSIIISDFPVENITQCFSATTLSPRIYPSIYNDWLPLTIFRLSPSTSTSHLNND